MFSTVAAIAGLAPAAAQRTDTTRTRGNAKAPVTVYEMADFQCPACRQFALTELPSVERDFIRTGKVRWVFVNFPLTQLHKNTVPAAELGLCASHQGRFWTVHDLLFRHQDDWADLDDPVPYLLGLADSAHLARPALLACLQAPATRQEIEEEGQSSVRAGARATPSFWVEGGLIEGAPPYALLKAVLDSIYRAKTSAPAAPSK